MIQVDRSETVAATPGQVWAVLGEFGAIGHWADNVDHSCLMTDQTDGVGVVRRIQTGRATVVERVTEWVEAAELTYVIEGLPPVLASVTNSWTLTPQGSGTLVTITTKIVPGPKPPHRLVAKVAARKMAEASEQMLSGLADRLSLLQEATS